MNRIRSDQRGYILLISLLVIGAASLTGVLAIIINGADSSKESLLYQQSVLAKDSAEACAEIALNEIKLNILYAGSGNSNQSNSSCSYTVTYDEGDFTINSTGISGNSTRKIKIYATIMSSNISITSWQEVSDF